MLSEFQDLIVAVLELAGIVVAGILAIQTGLIIWAVKEIVTQRMRLDILENDFGEAISLLNAVGVWLSRGAKPIERPHVPASLIEHVTTWPAVAPVGTTATS